MTFRHVSWWSLLFGGFLGFAGCGEDAENSTLGAVCGGEIGTSCAESEYCAYAPPTDCGRADGTARCEARPEACPEIYQPVCGCDGKTYSSACEAARSGVGYESDGACEGSQACAGLTGLGCPEGEFCFMALGQCLGPDPSGTCLAPPVTCTTDDAPVCGCDGKTYSNACIAAMDGINVMYAGSCEST